MAKSFGIGFTLEYYLNCRYNIKLEEKCSHKIVIWFVIYAKLSVQQTLEKNSEGHSALKCFFFFWGITQRNKGEKCCASTLSV